MTRLTLSKAINEGLRRALEDDPKAMIMGEDVGRLGGVFRVTDGLQKDFGEHRVMDTPLAESGIIGTAIGLALRGYRPVCEIQFDGFVYPATDQIVSQLAKMHYRSQGKVKLPVVIRIPFGGGIGAVEHHSESPEVFFAHTAGLRVVACADAADAFAMIQLAIASDDPVIFFEPKRRYWDKGEVDTAAPLEDALPLDKARIVVAGDDVTVLSYGPLVRTCAEAASAAREDGRSIEVIDLRSLSPLDMETIAASVSRTGRCVVTHEAPVYAGLGAEIAARVTERCFYQLEAPVLRVGGFAIAVPAGPDGGPLPARPGPHPGRRRPHVRLLTRRAQHEQGVQAPRRRGGPDRGRHRLLARQAGRHDRGRPGHRGDRDGEGGRRAAQPVRGYRHRTAGGRGADRRRGHADHRGRRGRHGRGGRQAGGRACHRGAGHRGGRRRAGRCAGRHRARCH